LGAQVSENPPDLAANAVQASDARRRIRQQQHVGRRRLRTVEERRNLHQEVRGSVVHPYTAIVQDKLTRFRPVAAQRRREDALCSVDRRRSVCWFRGIRRYDCRRIGGFEGQYQIRLGPIVPLPEVQRNGTVVPRVDLHRGMRNACYGPSGCRPADRAGNPEIPHRSEIGQQGQAELAPVLEGLQRQREVQQDAFFVLGKDRKDAHLEQVVADLFEDRRVALAIDDRLVDPRGLLAFDQLALDQFAGRHVHGKPADRGPVRQVNTTCLPAGAGTDCRTTGRSAPAPPAAAARRGRGSGRRSSGWASRFARPGSLIGPVPAGAPPGWSKPRFALARQHPTVGPRAFPGRRPREPGRALAPRWTGWSSAAT
jgi:hypothetical protein